MERHINIFIKNDLFRGKPLPCRKNRRLYPKRSDIANHLHKATIQHRISKIDQENLHRKVQKWKKSAPNDSFFYRSYGDISLKKKLLYDESAQKTGSLKSDRANKLLFVHQNENQRRLMNLYGQHLCLLDATYKTTKYAVYLQ